MNKIQYSPYFMYNPLFDQSIIDEAIKHVKEDWPNEACGAIINNKYERFENKAEDKSNTFMILDDDFNRAYIKGEVQCVIHSHNDYPMATVEDQNQQLAMDIPFGIINLVNRSVKHVMFWGEQVPIAPYKGRFFFYGGGFDCFSLVRDWWTEHYGVRSPNLARDFAFWHEGVNLFESHMDSMPSYSVETSEIKPGDVLLYNINGTKYINHCAIYLENGLVLHHLYNQLSMYAPITQYREFLIRAERFDPKYKE